MATFAVFDPTRDKDLSEHASLADAYREIDRLNNTYGPGRFGVRLAREHRASVERREELDRFLLPS